ncbi:MAG: hypothetical protein ABW133_16025 [Polyangiaceae bacterium]
MFFRRVNTVARMGFAGVLCAAFAACLSPTLPVPPPEPLALQEPLARLQPGGKSILIDGNGAVKGGVVSLWNEELGEGILVRADDDGGYSASLRVDVTCRRPHNHIQLWQTDPAGIMSDIKTYRLPNTLGDVPLPPDNAGCPDSGVGEMPDAGAPEAGTD